MSAKHILAVAGKDWRLFWADRRAAALAFVVPVVLASAFGLVFARPTADRGAPQLPVAVVVEDHSAFARAVADELLASPRFAAVEMTRAAAEAAVADRRPGVAIVLPSGFERAAAWAGERPVVELLHHPTTAAERQWAEGVLTETVMRKLARDRFGDTAALAPPFRAEATSVAGAAGGFDSYTHSFCGMTLQYLLFWGMESGLLFLRERRRGAWVRVRAAPVSLAAVLAGKALATAGIALLMIGVTFGVGRVAFGVTAAGSWLGFALLALAGCGLAAATGLLVAAVGGTEARARSVSILVILGVSMLGGLWVPAFLLPEWVRDAALALPTTWAMRGLDRVTWQGRGLAEALPYVAAVTAFASAFLALAAWRLTADERRRAAGLGA
ncbi:ABC transporter permease [Urbifossiella limnaea]|uniref:ABC-2 family transporter protein n=1 Tax=Urbifossiella limnaea TaxID=2528023 RepID=A0A517XMS6_9BACT|nr:ABC transporter permease [Urbifossiella limnaea]QDU18805.1 ABC-2 family transporter protein [Urbifossiella limnaea]